tara:strand:- start:196 stop:429 length:234 start_codon:yes stop_codon:yes gene_type:complete
MKFNNTEVLLKKRSIVDKITAKLCTPPVSYRDYLDGIQVNWVVNGKSYMWRSNDCPDRVEVYIGNDYDIMYMYLDEV